MNKIFQYIWLDKKTWGVYLPIFIEIIYDFTELNQPKNGYWNRKSMIFFLYKIIRLKVEFH